MPLTPEAIEALKTTAPYVGSALAWSLLCANVVIVPFYNKNEKLHADYVHSGALELARSRILSEHTMPVVASVVKTVLDNRPNKKQTVNIDIAEILDASDISADLEALETAISRYRTLDSTYNRLKRYSGPVALTGLIHVICTLSLAVSVYFDVAGNSISSTTFVVAILWLASLFGTIGLFVAYRRWTNSLLDQLGERRSGPPKKENAVA